MIKNEKKANCHLHITGSLSPKDLRVIASKTGLDINTFGQLKEKITFFDPDIWAIAKRLTSTRFGLEEAIKIILKKESGDNVVHVELTINPTGMLRRGLTISELVSTLEISSSYASALGITLKIKLGVNRKDGKESTKEVKKVYDQCPKEIVAAIDLNGDEKNFPTETFERDFLSLREEGILTTIHAGEYFGSENSLISAIKMKPARIAHCLVASNNEAILEKIKQDRIVLEISPLSGLNTEAFSDIGKLPIRKFLDHKIPLVFGSDDPAIFNKTLSDHLFALKDCGLEMRKIVELNKKSFDYLFK